VGAKVSRHTTLHHTRLHQTTPTLMSKHLLDSSTKDKPPHLIGNSIDFNVPNQHDNHANPNHHHQSRQQNRLQCPTIQWTIEPAKTTSSKINHRHSSSRQRPLTRSVVLQTKLSRTTSPMAARSHPNKCLYRLPAITYTCASTNDSSAQ
jgi:hypothetical protein